MLDRQRHRADPHRQEEEAEHRGSDTQTTTIRPPATQSSTRGRTWSRSALPRRRSPPRIAGSLMPAPRTGRRAGPPSSAAVPGGRRALRKYSWSKIGWAMRLDSANPPSNTASWVACAASAERRAGAHQCTGTATSTTSSSTRKPRSSGPAAAGRPAGPTNRSRPASATTAAAGRRRAPAAPGPRGGGHRDLVRRRRGRDGRSRRRRRRSSTTCGRTSSMTAIRSATARSWSGPPTAARSERPGVVRRRRAGHAGVPVRAGSAEQPDVGHAQPPGCLAQLPPAVAAELVGGGGDQAGGRVRRSPHPPRRGCR